MTSTNKMSSSSVSTQYPLTALTVLIVTSYLFTPCFTQQSDPCTPLDSNYEQFLKISESAEIGDVVFTVPINASSTEVILSASYNEYFGFNSSSREIFVNGTVDAETMFISQSVDVNCKNRVTGQTITIRVNIEILDANDNGPVFTQDNYTLVIGEMTKLYDKIATPISATDRDASPDHSLIFYEIEDGPYSDYFVIIDPLKTVLELQKELDYEQLPEFSITIIAKNQNRLSTVQFNSSVVVYIEVKDEDDQYPVFNSSMYRGVITSSATVDSVVPISPVIYAYDPDLTIREKVVYSFHGEGRNILNIEPNTGVVTLVNKPTSDEVYLLVQATQVDTPSRYGVALLAVQVQGSNVNAPRFLTRDFTVVKTELFPVGEMVTMVMATDDDPGTILTYSLEDDTKTFLIDQETGHIILVKPFNATEKSVYELKVTASDGFLSSSTTVVVTVKAVNNKPPVITNRDGLNVSLSRRQKGDSVVRILATDNDIDGGALTYKVVTHEQLFSINPAGFLKVSADGPFYDQDLYQVAVVVSDSGLPPYETVAVVNVEFPPPPKTAAATMGETDTLIPIILGCVVAVLLIIVVILAVFICRRRLREKEHLDRVKRQNPHYDAKALAFKQKQATLGRKAAGKVNIDFQDELSDGTTIQENPLSTNNKGGYYNFGQLNGDSDTEGIIEPHDIQVETSVVPYDEPNDDNNNDNIYNTSQYSADSEDYQPNGKHALAPFFRNGSLSTFRDSSGSDASVNISPNDSNDSKKGLVPGPLARTRLPEESSSLNGHAVAPNDDMNYTDPDASVVPAAQKQELTVYF